MSLHGKTFRLFVSSTFSDFKAEREILQERVFPAVRQACRQRGWDFVPIDLRWGVTDEAALDQQTMRICLEEVARCQETGLEPNFMILLGDRYGWRPLPFEIETSRFDAIRATVADPADLLLLDTWYRCDENSLGPTHVLQPRLGALAAFADWGAWDPVERRLRELFGVAIDRIGLAGDDRLPFEASATEQEIVAGALRVPDAHEHVLAFVRTIRGLPASRAAKDFLDLDETGARDAFAQERLSKLRDTLAERLHQTLFTYDTEWRDETVASDHLERFASDAEKHLCRLCLEEMKRHEETPASWREAEAHRSFTRENAAHFVGRDDLLTTVRQYLSGTNASMLALAGPSGIGKSALMAGAAADAARHHPGSTVLSRFIGITPGSTDLRTLLENLVSEISEIRGREVPSIPDDLRGLLKTFAATLVPGEGDPDLILFLDSLDQLSHLDQARRLHWLPHTLPPRVKVIVSTLFPGECGDILQGRLSAGYFHLVPPLPADEGERLLTAWLTASGRALQKDQKRLVLERFTANGNPLFLKLCHEEARHWPSFQPLPDLAADIRGVMEQLFARLTVRHGEEFVGRSLGYLAAARHGLAEQELPDVLTSDREFLDHFRDLAHHDLPKIGDQPRLPGVIFSRFLSDLRPYLAEKVVDDAVLLHFFHHEFGRIAEERFLPGETRKRFHAGLGEYFARLPLQFPDEEQDRADRRKLAEQAFQQTLAGAWKQTEALLCGLEFIAAKCGSGMTSDLVMDFQRLLETAPPTEITARMKDFARFVRGQAHVLKRFPALTFQQALNQPAASEPARIAQEQGKAAEASRPYLLWINRPASPDPTLLTMTGHDGIIRSCAWSKDGTTILSTSDDGTARCWDAATGGETLLMNPALGKLRAGGFSPDGRWLVVGSDSGWVVIFDAASGAEKRRWQAHDLPLTAAEACADGTTILTAGHDGCWKLWEAGGGTLLRSASLGEAEAREAGSAIPRIFAAASSPDGRFIAVGCDDRKIRLYDRQAGKLLGTIDTPGGWCRCLSFFPDSRRLVFGSTDGTVGIWVTDTGESQLLPRAHSDWIRSCAVSHDGRRVATGGADLHLILWDVERAAPIRRFSGHTDRILCCGFSPEGDRLVSGSADQTLRLFETAVDAGFDAGFAGETEARTGVGAGVGLPSERSGRHGAAVTVCRFLSGDTRLVSAAEDGSLAGWDSRTGLRAFDRLDHTDRITCCEPLPGTDLFLTAGHDRAIRLWKSDREKPLATFSAHAGPVTSCALFPGGTGFVSGSVDCTLRVWPLPLPESFSESPSTGRETATLSGHSAPVRAVAISPDGRTIVSASDDRTLRCWDPATATEIRVLSGHTDALSCAGFSPDGLLIHSGSLDGTVRLWNSGSGQIVAVLADHEGGVTIGRWAPDRSFFLSGAEDGRLRLWDPRDGHLIREISAGAGPVTGGAVSPDGRCIASATLDGMLRLWNVSDGRPVASWVGNGALRGLSFSATGEFLAVGEDSGVVYLLRPQGFSFEPPLVTPWKAPDTWLGLRKGIIAACCPSCGSWSETPSGHATHGPSTTRAATAGVSTACRSCGQPFRYTAFSIAADPTRFLPKT